MLREQNESDELKDLSINSRFYCPYCTGGGSLYVKDEKKYINGKDTSVYYCKDCKQTFRIFDIIDGMEE